MPTGPRAPGPEAVDSLSLLALPLVVAAVLAAVWFLVQYPRLGYLLLALAAPVSHFLEVGGGPQGDVSLKLVHLVALGVILGILLRMPGRGSLQFNRMVAPHVAILTGLMFWAWATGGFGGTKFLITQLGSLALFVIVFWIYGRAESIERWLICFAGSLGVANALVMAGIVLAPTHARSLFFSAGSEGVRLQGTFESANQLASPQILAVAIYLYFALHGRGWIRWLSLGGAILSFAVVLGTQSRSAIGALFIVLALLVLIFLRESRRAMGPALIGTLVATLFVVAYLNLPKEVLGFELARVDSKKVELYDVSVSDIARERFWIFGPVLATLANNPLGLGYSFHAEVLWEEQGTFRQPHNSILKTMLTYGIVGGVYVNLLYYLPPLWILWLAWRRRLSLSSMAVFLAAGMLAYLAYGLFHSATQWIYVWLIWGLSVRLAQLDLLRARAAA